MSFPSSLKLFRVTVDKAVNAFCIQDVDSYIHRSGRTGRAGRPGISVVLYQPSESAGVSTVERVAVSSADANRCFCITRS